LLAQRIERLLGGHERGEMWRSVAAFTGTAASVLALAMVLSPAIPLAQAGEETQRPSIAGRLGGSDGRVLVEAAADGDMDSVRALLDGGANINRAVIGDGTALMVAARRGDERMVRFLLERGADVNESSHGDGNALIGAAAHGDLVMVKLLVEHGAQVNAFVMGDETPLINAARAGNIDVVNYLVTRGADVNYAVPAEEGPFGEIRSPLSEARRLDRRAVVERLVELGAR
jgi:ankyrin repeat protein